MAAHLFPQMQLAIPPPAICDGVASAIAQAVLKMDVTETGDAPEPQRHPGPLPNDDAASESSDSSDIIIPPIPGLFVIPQSLYRPIPSLSWTGSHDCSIGRIAFDLKKQAEGKHGVPMSLLLNDHERTVAKALQGASDAVMSDLAKNGIQKVTLRIAWPAYPDYCFERDIEIVRTSPSSQVAGLISRAALARKVADAFLSFVQRSQTLPLSDDQWEAEFRFGRGALSFGHLWLVSIWQVGANVFEAEVRHSRVAQS
ncbi:hypothetical protein C8T65DRAFT_743319 [Cerioporus squamosus]|nr:hypothetical protein C8T65DRAFT_743319 [Cerioporus squamosus]